MKILRILMIMAATASLAFAQSKTEPVKLNAGDPAINGLIVKPNVVLVTQTTEKDGAVVNRLSFTLATSAEEADGKKVLHVTMKGDGPSAPLASEILLDAKTLVPLKVSQSMNGRSRTMLFDGTKLHTTAKASADAEPSVSESTLSAVPFLGNAADVVVSAMKLKTGMTFTLPVFSQGPDVEWQTFEVTAHEDFKTAKGSVPVWVVKQTGAAMTGTLYTADEPPYLYRWIFEFKNGTRVTIDQELVSN